MKKRQSGFTLIELVIVIVILGILAATAIPKFLDISTDAEEASAQAAAGAVQSAAVISYAKAKGANPWSSIEANLVVSSTGGVSDYTFSCAYNVATGCTITVTVAGTGTTEDTVIDPSMCSGC